MRVAANTNLQEEDFSLVLGDWDGAEPPIRGVPVYFFTSVLNFIDNAIEQVTRPILDENSRAGVVSVNFFASGPSSLAIEINDHAGGFQAEFLEAITKAIEDMKKNNNIIPFDMNSSRRLSSKSGGHLGLGILLSVRYFHTHIGGGRHGSVAITSDCKTGTKISIDVPYNSDQSSIVFPFKA